MPSTTPEPRPRLARPAQAPSGAPPLPDVLAEVTRGAFVESRHVGHMAVVSPDGTLLASVGDPDRVVLLRSAVKPFQVVPLIATGAADRFGFPDDEIAIACASHNGEDLHVRTVTSILDKIGMPPEAMTFGLRSPLDPAACQALEDAGQEPTPQHHECSGEHAGKLALAVHLGADVERYLLPDEPVEMHALRAVAQFSGVAEGDVRREQDNCGVVTFGIPLRAAAQMYARLVAPLPEWDARTGEACARIVRAMTRHPDLVSGTDAAVSLDTVLMRQRPGALLSKMGAEGIWAGAVVDSERFGGPVGVVVKVEDGDSEERVRGPVAVALLRRLGVFSDEDAAALGDHREPPVDNDKDQQVGLVRATLPAW